MFDANAAHIPCGVLFFAQVDSSNEELISQGVSAGDIILCKHIEKGGERNRDILLTEVYTSQLVMFYYKEQEFQESRIDLSYGWLRYSGLPCGNGFIDDHWKEKALEFLGGEWKSN